MLLYFIFILYSQKIYSLFIVNTFLS